MMSSVNYSVDSLRRFCHDAFCKFGFSEQESDTSTDVLIIALSGCERYELITHTGSCNEQRAEEIAEYALANGYDVILGVGGGVIMDFAKLCSHFAGISVVNLPTSSATCAAYTPLSVRYTPDGRTVGSLHYKREIDAVVVDTEIVAAQPTRLIGNLYFVGIYSASTHILDTGDGLIMIDPGYLASLHIVIDNLENRKELKNP